MILVAGSLNHDRVWSLDGPLAPGSRLRWSSRRMTLGGGGLYTAMRLRGLGAGASLVTSLADDPRGRATLDWLTSHGIDTGRVMMRPGRSRVADILLGADGERTILFPPGEKPALDTAACAPRAAYVNATALGPGLAESLARAGLSLSQLPLGRATPRPADIAITSAADFPGQGPQALFERAVGLCSPRLRLLVITDGRRPTRLVTARESRLLPAGPAIDVANTTGAGDSFAAALLHGLCAGLSPDEAALEASRLTALWLQNRPAYALPEAP